MTIKDVIELIMFIGVIGGFTVTITKKISSKNSKKDSNNKNNISQQAISGRDTNQAGRDNNVK